MQQQLYEEDQQYTSQWERRLFKRIGNYLMKNNKSISQCFDLIDTDNSDTISFDVKKKGALKYVIHTKVGDGPRVLEGEEHRLLDARGLPKNL